MDGSGNRFWGEITYRMTGKQEISPHQMLLGEGVNSWAQGVIVHFMRQVMRGVMVKEGSRTYTIILQVDTLYTLSKMLKRGQDKVAKFCKIENYLSLLLQENYIVSHISTAFQLISTKNSGTLLTGCSSQSLSQYSFKIVSSKRAHAQK